MGIELQAGENQLGSWAVYYERAGARQGTGDLIVTDRRLLFDPKMEAGSRSIRQARQMLSGNWKEQNAVAIDRAQVTGVSAEKRLLSKKVLISAGGRTYIFNRGLLSVDPIVAALGQG